MNNAHLRGRELKGLWKEFTNRKETWDESRELETVGGGEREEWARQESMEKTENETSVWSKLQGSRKAVQMGQSPITQTFYNYSLNNTIPL